METAARILIRCDVGLVASSANITGIPINLFARADELILE